MNEYRICFLNSAGESHHVDVTDRTEAAAKKFFRESAKELGRTFQGIELLRTDAPATKRNERETLETIRNLVADLGRGSYLGTAFEGCFEIAEQNIEFDFGDSMKGLVESAERKLAEAEEEIKRLDKLINEERKDHEAALAVSRSLSEEKDAEIAALQAQVMGEDDLEDIRQALDDQATEDEEMAERAAAEIVKFAEDTDIKEFRQAVIDHRNYTSRAKYYREILGRVVDVQVAIHAGA